MVLGIKFEASTVHKYIIIRFLVFEIIEKNRGGLKSKAVLLKTMI
jgi:hypothetical protein